jgi:pimeloyl-ACP methyl ester carboxylesterase
VPRPESATAPRLAVVVLVLAALSLAAPCRADERVDITATDGVQLIGELGGTSGPGVVLAPAAQQTRGVWAAAASAIAARGFRTLRFDPRGQGDSSGAVDPAAAASDVEGAYRYMLARKIRPVFLIGEGASGPAVVSVARRVAVAGVVVVGASPADAAADLAVPHLFLGGDARNLRDEDITTLVKFLSAAK